MLEDAVGQQRRRRHLDHHAGRQAMRADLCRQSVWPLRRWRSWAPSPTAGLPVRSRGGGDGLQLALQAGPGCPRRSGCRGHPAPGWPPRDARRTSAACPSRRPASGSPPCGRRRPRAPRRRSGPARRRSVRCRGSGSTARCGRARRPRPGFLAADRAAAPSCTLARISTAWPSAVAPGPDQCAAAAAASRCACATASAAAGGVGRHGDGVPRCRRPSPWCRRGPRRARRRRPRRGCRAAGR